MKPVAPKPTFAAVAVALGDPTLTGKLEMLSSQVVILGASEESDPKITDVRKDFREAREAAVEMDRVLDRVINRFYWMTFDDLEKLFRARRAMREVTEMAEPKLPTAGRVRARRNCIGARECCAIIVLEAWALVHGNWPGANNLRLQQICGDYWRVCSEGESVGAPENWRRPLMAGLKNDSSLRLLIRAELGTKSP